MKIPSDYLDKFNMPVTFKQDGGDSAHRVGMYHTAIRLSAQDSILTELNYTKRVNMLINGEGNIRRHPDESKWYGDWDRASRDQSIPFLISLFTLSRLSEAKSFLKAHLKRALLFTTNTRRNGVIKGDPEYKWKLPDITGPVFWSIYIRGFRNKWLYPVLCIFDLFLLLNTITFNLRPRENNNLLLLLHLSKKNLPTLMSYIATKIASKDIMKVTLKEYWHKDRGPYMLDLLLPLVEKL